MASRQVSWLTGHRIRSVFPAPEGSSDMIERILAAYSCGGSFGIAPKRRTEFPLSSGVCEQTRRTTTAYVLRIAAGVST